MLLHFDLLFLPHQYNQPERFESIVNIKGRRVLTETTANSLAATCNACARSNRCFAFVNVSFTSRSFIRAS